MAKWSELEKQGINRCCASFTTGKQCRRRAAGDGIWCDKHQWVGRTAKAMNDAAMEADRKSNADIDKDED